MMTEQLLGSISVVLRIPVEDIDLKASFIELGGHSLSAIGLVSAWKWQGLSIEVESVLTSSSIENLISRATRFHTSHSGHVHIPNFPIKASRSYVKPEVDSPYGTTTRAMPRVQRSDGRCHVRSISSPSNDAEFTHFQSQVRRFSSSANEVRANQARKFVRRIPSSASDVQNGCRRGSSGFLRCALSDEAYTMTEMQLSLIHGSQRAPGINIIRYVEKYRTRDIPTMKQAWKTVIDSEPIFRMSFDICEGTSVVSGLEAAPFRWSEVTVQDRQAYEAQIKNAGLSTMEIGSGFEAITLVPQGQNEGESAIVWYVHHALMDGYSATIILRKLRQAVAGFPLVSGPSFAGLARELLALQRRSKALGQRFWKQQLERYPSCTGELLLATPPSLFAKENDTRVFRLKVPAPEVLSYAQRASATSTSLYYAAWALTLSMYTGSQDVVFGVVHSGRNLPLPRIANTVGPMLNTLPLYVSLNRATSAIDYLRQVFSSTVDLMAFQWTIPEHGFTRQFSSAIAMQFEIPITSTTDVRPLEEPYSQIVSDLPLYVTIQNDGSIMLNYHSNVYNDADIEMIGSIFHSAILALLRPYHTVDMCLEGLLSCQSRQDLNRLGNCVSGLTTLSSVRDDLVTLFQNAAAESAELNALEKGTSCLTYAELDRLSSVIAEHLSSIIQPHDVVCVHADRSLNWIVAIYGVLKAGGVYCPFDVSHSPELRESNFQSAGGGVFLTPSAIDKALRPSSCTLCFSVEELVLETRKLPGNTLTERNDPISTIAPQSPAYLCFTSGSSGKPKGVLCTHHSLVAFQRDLEVRLFAAPGKRISQIMSPAFDGSIHEIFSALSYGATLVLQDSANPFAHLKFVDSAVLTPSIAKALDPLEYPQLSNLYLVGEPVSQRLGDYWSTHKAVYNMYGPTEATCGATIKKLSPGSPVTLGTPNSSTRVYILNQRQALVPRGVIGDIYLAGIQISRGYFGRPDETARSFMPDVICPDLGERMYKTGDKGYWNANGELVYLGREDRQIKLRGFRLDLNDIETRILNTVQEITAVAVVQKQDYLVAMVMPASVDVTTFRSRITKALPPHGLPRCIVATDELPMTTAGKVDYKVVADAVSITKTMQKKNNFSLTEKRVARAWQEVLGLASNFEITADSNFLDLGGSSIFQLLLSNKLSRDMGYHIRLRDIIEYPILHDLAKTIDGLGSSKANKLQRHTTSDQDISPIEQEWYRKIQIDQSSSAFNVSFACALGETVDHPRLEFAWNTILSRHYILRCRYITHNHGFATRSYSSFLPSVRRVERLDIWEEINRPFDLRLDHPIRVSISPSHVVIAASHIICDLATLQVLLNEVMSIYNGEALALIKRTYKEASIWDNFAHERSLSFWTTYLESYTKPTLPWHHFEVAKTTFHGASSVFKVSAELYSNMLKYTAVNHFTLHQLVLAAAALALQYDREDQDIILGAPYFNRTSEDDLEVVGLFLEPLPIRIRFPSPAGMNSAHDSIATTPNQPVHDDLLKVVQKSSHAALVNAVPWNRLLEHLRIDPEFPEHPLFDVMVTFHEQRQGLRFLLPDAKPTLTWTQGAKFKLMIEFQAVSDTTLMLRLEYDAACFRAEEIALFERLMTSAIDCLVSSVDIVRAKARLQTEAEAGVSRLGLGDDGIALFGVELDRL